MIRLTLAKSSQIWGNTSRILAASPTHTLHSIAQATTTAQQCQLPQHPLPVRTTANTLYHRPCTSTFSRSFSSRSTSNTPSDADLAQWQSFNTAGLKYLATGAFDKAAMLFMSAMKEPVVQNTVYQYLSLSNLGIAFRHLERYEEAKNVILQALTALKNYSQIHDGMIANLYRESALATESLGLMEEAESLLNHSLHYYSQHALAREHTANTQSHATDQSTKFSAAAEQSKLLLETAATHYTLALLIHKTATAAANAAANASSSSSSSSTAPRSKLPAGVHLRLREAERHYRDALKMMRAVYGSDPTSKSALNLAPVLSSMGTMYHELGENESANRDWMEAMTIYQHHQDPRLLPILDAYMAALEKQDPLYAQMLQQQASSDANPSTSSSTSNNPNTAKK